MTPAWNLMNVLEFGDKASWSKFGVLSGPRIGSLAGNGAPLYDMSPQPMSSASSTKKEVGRGGGGGLVGLVDGAPLPAPVCCAKVSLEA